MENTSNVSSEEELLQLRNEGKISEDEYKGLLVTMQKTKKIDTEPTTSEIDKTKSKHKLGKIAFVLMLVGIILPLVGLALAAGPSGERAKAAPKQVSVAITIGQEKAAQLQKEAEQRVEQLMRASKDKRTRMLITTGSFLLLGLVLEIAAFVMGVISWPDVFGKATVITISVLTVLLILFTS